MIVKRETVHLPEDSFNEHSRQTKRRHARVSRRLADVEIHLSTNVGATRNTRKPASHRGRSSLFHEIPRLYHRSSSLEAGFARVSGALHFPRNSSQLDFREIPSNVLLETNDSRTLEILPSNPLFTKCRPIVLATNSIYTGKCNTLKLGTLDFHFYRSNFRVVLDTSRFILTARHEEKPLARDIRGRNIENSRFQGLLSALCTPSNVSRGLDRYTC